MGFIQHKKGEQDDRSTLFRCQGKAQSCNPSFSVQGMEGMFLNRRARQRENRNFWESVQFTVRVLRATFMMEHRSIVNLTLARLIYYDSSFWPSTASSRDSSNLALLASFFGFSSAGAGLLTGSSFLLALPLFLVTSNSSPVILLASRTF